MMPQFSVWLIAALVGANIVLSIVLLLRLSHRFRGAESLLREDLKAGREESRTAGKELREEMGASLRSASDLLMRTFETLGQSQQGHLDGMTKQLKELQLGNERKLDEMRTTVDEKLHEALEKRLGESFKLVSERLDSVHRGLGEMQQLAAGVGDLRRVLTNVKARGTWAEVQLGAILEQFLTPEQFARNVRLRHESADVVEFAVRLPGASDRSDATVWLPIDSKFPQEDYLRIQDAADAGNAEAVQQATESMMRTIRLEARTIRDKYICPPHSTDFAIMFLATEGLYAEVLRQPALVDELLRDCRVVVAGPTTVAAILSSLRMGFQTVAIKERAAEVWTVLGEIKTEFRRFGDVMAKVKRQLEGATRAIEQTDVRARAMERKLRDVEERPVGEAAVILELPGDSDASDGAPELPEGE